MIEYVKVFLFCVDVFFIIYLFGYSTFYFCPSSSDPSISIRNAGMMS